ncbi:MAG: adenylate kinase family protein, partial [Conexivisphaera sp.]|jgi:adenylate kinase
LTRGSVIGIAGVPAVGKKTVGAILAKRLGCRHSTVLELATETNSVLEYDESNSEYVVDVDSMRRLLDVRPPPGICVLSGVLVTSVLPRSRASLAVVLRASPDILYPRYVERGYPGDKMRDNLLAEALGVAVDEAVRAYGEDLVHEVDTSGRDPASIASEIIDVISGSRRPSILRLDWLDVCERVGHLRAICFPELPSDLD